MKDFDYNSIKEKIDRCKKVKLNDIKLEDVDDFNNIKIDMNKSSNERILEFLNSVKNPYAFKMNDKIIKISFSDSNLSAEESVCNVFKSIYKK